MERQIATVGNDGQLVLPAEIQHALGIHPGSRVEIILQEHGVELVVQEQPRRSPEEVNHLIHELQTMFAGEPSLEDEYFRDREKDKW